MKRKVILHGPATLTVSLPSKWAKANGVKKGSEVEVSEMQAQLMITAGDNPELIKSTSVDFSGLDNQTINSIISILHKSGYDKIEVFSSDPSVVNTVQERINSMLMGYEIVDQRGRSFTIRSLSTDQVGELDNLVRRSFLITVSMGSGLLEQIGSGTKSSLQELLVLENTINKLVNYCHRLLNKKNNRDEKTTYLYLITWIIESICDDYRDLIKAILSQKKQQAPSRALIECIEEVNSAFKSYYHFFYNYSDRQNMEIRKQLSASRRKIESSALPSHEQALRQYFLSIVSRIYDCLGSAAGINH